MSHSDQMFYISPTCSKILRKWQIIDWCQYTPGNSYNGYTPGLWVFYQHIKISKGDIPVLTCPADVTVNSFNCTDAYANLDPLYVDGDACGGNFNITNDSPFATNNGANASGTYPAGWHTIRYTVEFGCGDRKTLSLIHI